MGKHFILLSFNRDWKRLSPSLFYGRMRRIGVRSRGGSGFEVKSKPETTAHFPATVAQLL